MPWTIHKDPSGRAHCCGCHQLIDKGSLRMDNNACRHRVLLCTGCIPRSMTATKLNNTIKVYGAMDNIPGFAALKKINPDVYADLLALLSDVDLVLQGSQKLVLGSADRSGELQYRLGIPLLLQ